MQSINVVESCEFCNILLLCCEGIKDKDIPHCMTIQGGVIKAWKVHFYTLQKEMQVSMMRPIAYLYNNSFFLFQNSLWYISFNMDLWSDNDWGSYLALTAHWISHSQDGALELHSGLPGFHYFFGAHTGDHLSTALLSLLDRVSITPKGISVCDYPHNFDLTAAFYRLTISLLMVPKTTLQCCGPCSQHWNCVVLSSV